VAKLREVSDRHCGALRVVRHHRSVPRAGERHVHPDARDVGAQEPLDLGISRVHAHEHGSVDAVVAGPLQVGVRAVAVAGLLAGEEEQVEARRADHVLQPAKHLVEERVLDVGVALTRLEEDTDHVGALHHQRPRRRGWRVIELLGEPDHALPRLRADVGVAVQRPRDGPHGDTADAG
jgi:hypothetical protein